MFDLDRWEEIWQTISRNRKRSIMTAFGVFWGIFMLTIMLGAGLGLKNALFSQLGDMSVNSCFFWGGRTSIPYKGLPSGRYWQFENEDLAAIKKQVPNVRSVGSVIWGSEYKFSRNDKKGDYSLVGYNTDLSPWNRNPRSGTLIMPITVRYMLFMRIVLPTGSSPPGNRSSQTCSVRMHTLRCCSMSISLKNRPNRCVRAK